MKKILFIGAGKMARAIAKGMVANGFSAKNLAAFDVLPEAAKLFTQETGVAAASTGLDSLLAKADTVLLAVKPQYLASAVKSAALNKKFVLSIVAGVPLKKLAQLTGAKKIVRVMPNTPALVGAGCSGYAISAAVTKEEAKAAERLLSSFGKAFLLEEHLLNAVTALSGSGPAYVFDFITALADGGVACGLPRGVALELAAGTVAGSAKLVTEAGRHPGELRDAVTSPAGTTIAALEVLEDRAFRGAVIAAVKAAAARSEELGRNA